VARAFPWGDLPKLRREDAELATWLAAALAEPWRGGIGARLLEVAPMDASRWGEHAVAVPVLGAGWTVALVMSGALARSWAAETLTDDGVELAAPRPLTLVERGIAPLLAAAMVEELGIAARVGELAPTERVRAWIGDGWGAELELTFGARRGTAWLVAGREAIRRMPRRPAAEGIDLAVVVAAELGRVRVGQGAVAALARRDVIRAASRPRLAVGRGGFAVELGDWRRGGDVLVRINGPYRGQGAAMDPVLAAELPVELALELGRLELKAAEALALAPGAVLTLPRAVGGLIDVVAGGRVIARGELVDVEGAIGVRVTELVPG